MSANKNKARLEASLLEIWYGGHKPGLLKQASLNGLELIYKVLRTLSRQDTKARLSKKQTKPPVLVVGNLIAGGAGKTPIVMAICQYLSSQNKQVGIVSRGYGRSSSRAALIDPSKPLPSALQVGDEPLFLCAETHCPVAVCADRNQAVETLVSAFPDLDLIVSDDGLQHHRLARQIEWVVFDERAHGNGRLLPAGPLREPLARLNSVEAVLSSNMSTEALAAALNRPAQSNWHEVHVSLRGFRQLQTGKFMTLEQARESWKESSLLAFTGMANPEKLFKAIESAGFSLSETRALPDHFRYPESFCAHFNQAVLITGGKDAVKLNASNSKVWVAEIHVDLPPALTQALEECIGSTTD